MRRECPNASPECKYYGRKPPQELRGLQEHGCFEDIEHLIPRRAGTCALSRYIIRRPENQEWVCRAEHDEKNHRESLTGVDDHQIPSVEEMAEMVERDQGAGIHIPVRVAKRLNQLLEQTEVERYWNEQSRG